MPRKRSPDGASTDWGVTFYYQLLSMYFLCTYFLCMLAFCPDCYYCVFCVSCVFIVFFCTDFSVLVFNFLFPLNGSRCFVLDPRIWHGAHYDGFRLTKKQASNSYSRKCSQATVMRAFGKLTRFIKPSLWTAVFDTGLPHIAAFARYRSHPGRLLTCAARRRLPQLRRRCVQIKQLSSVWMDLGGREGERAAGPILRVPARNLMPRDSVCDTQDSLTSRGRREPQK